MTYQFSPNMIPLAVAALISAALAWYTWRYRQTQGARSFAWMMFILFQWGFSYIMELAAIELSAKLAWATFMFAGVVATPVAWLTFALEYTGQQWMTRTRLLLLSILPLVTLGLIITNGEHSLFWASANLHTEGGFRFLSTTNGPWFWVHAIYTYSLILLGLILIVRALLLWPPQYRGQMYFILFSTLTPLIANVMTVFQLVPVRIDLTPFAFTVTGLGMGYALFRHHLLDITPIARELVIDGMKDGMIVLDARRRIVDINPTAAQLFRQAGTQSLIGLPIAEVLQHWPHLIERYRNILETEDEIAIGEGENQRWFELTVSALRDENQHVIGQVIAIREVTQRRRAEILLQENETRFRQIVENASDLIYRFDVNGYLTYANPAALRAMGFDREEDVLGQYFLDLTMPDARHRLKRIYQHQYLSQTKTTYHEFPAIAADGREVWFGQKVQLIYEGEAVIGFQALARDITAIKQAQDALRIARDQALDASRAISQLLSKVSHELRTPLGGILGYAELLRDNTFGELTPAQRKGVLQIVDSANYLTNMVNELLDEAQIQASTATLQEKPFKPADLLQNACAGMEVLAQKKGLQFTSTLGAGLPEELLGDERRLRQILINLVGNAIKFTRSGGVHVQLVKASENHWAIRVEDTGIGIPKDAQSYIFEPFRQVDSTITRDNRGIGLGLSITKQLVDLMGGRIMLQSEMGKGSAFTVVLPMLRLGDKS